jgi:hypothetical protein
MSDAVDLEAVKQAQQKTWSEGDFAMVAGLIMGVAEDLAEALDIVPGERVLDVACGSGNGAIAAARRSWGNVVGADFVPALLERDRERTAAERLDIEFVEGDAENLPFGDGEFDLVMSIFGASARARGRLSDRSITGWTSSAPISARPRSPSSGSASRARRRWKQTFAPTSKRPTRPGTAPWSWNPSTWR